MPQVKANQYLGLIRTGCFLFPKHWPGMQHIYRSSRENSWADGIQAFYAPLSYILLLKWELLFIMFLSLFDLKQRNVTFKCIFLNMEFQHIYKSPYTTNRDKAKQLYVTAVAKSFL